MGISWLYPSIEDIVKKKGGGGGKEVKIDVSDVGGVEG